MQNRNRALHGDTVILEILPESEWIVQHEAVQVEYYIFTLGPTVLINASFTLFTFSFRLITNPPPSPPLPQGESVFPFPAE